MQNARCILLALILSTILGCGGGGGGGGSGSAPPATTPAPPSVPVVTPSRTLVTLQSDAGDLIGQGKNYSYAKTNATITIGVRGNLITVAVSGDETWTAEFQTGGAATEPVAGKYSNLDAYVPSAGTAKPGLRWYGEGRGCSTSKGWFAIDSIDYAHGVLRSLSLRFERHCNGDGPALHGLVQFAATDQSAPPAMGPAPVDLWRPPAGTGAGPDGGNYVYLESSGGDYVGLEKTYLYNASNSEIWSNSGGNYLNVLVNGDQQWKAVFHAMESMGSIQVGYYPELRAYPLHNPTRGGMYWTGDGRGCSVINGWFAVDSLTVEDGIIKGFDLRFEQHCEGRASMLRGAVHWRADAAVTPVTISPSPAGSWRPPSGALDTNVNNLYLEGDPSGMPWYRRLHHFTPANATIAATASARTLQITATSGTTWTGDFQLSGNGVQLTPGLYGDLTRFMFPGQAEPGISWGGEHRGCSAPRGWLAIDSIAYDNGQLSAIDLRFEQVCEGAPLPTHGALHWRAESAVPAPGPIPAVVEMWRPPVAVVPASGTYVYLAPDRSDFIAGGSMYRYTPATAGITLTENDGALVLAVDGDEHWRMNFSVMSGRGRIEPGYYGALGGFPFHNPARGGFSWSGEARGCNSGKSGVIVDSVSYENGKLIALEMRFEQHCENRNAALRGAIRWVAADQTKPPGAVLPIPASLWQPAPGATPATGNFVFLQSEPGDFIGTDPATVSKTLGLPFTVSASGNRLHIDVSGGGSGTPLWSSDFITMSSQNQIMPGFYERLRTSTIFNPAVGGFSWWGDGRGCETSMSWVAIDKVTYSNGLLTALDARFEQHCDMKTAALRGVIHWVK